VPFSGYKGRVAVRGGTAADFRRDCKWVERPGEWSLRSVGQVMGRKGHREIVVSNIIWIIVIGFIAGIIARFLSPGPNTLNGFILTTALGIAGAFVATFIGQTIGWYRLDQGAGLIGATVGAVLVLFVWNRFVATRAPAAGDIRGPGLSPRRWL
jgi:uncharacterized membrane protein YeaQ/YmgE (transglycosylase-associated protein family)